MLQDDKVFIERSLEESERVQMMFKLRRWWQWRKDGRPKRRRQKVQMNFHLILKQRGRKQKLQAFPPATPQHSLLILSFPYYLL
ncbi:hypothetical protein BHM03_00023726 [Ensete ventricosum]|nr:hypothetical protein BHM03_00023726 [Ensete ventricosum]